MKLNQGQKYNPHLIESKWPRKETSSPRGKQSYNPGLIESKWQEVWEKSNLYQTDLSKSDNKYYVLVELPYTSGDLHMGHWFTFTYGDVLARYKRMKGFSVLYPNGFDAFGLPAENAAIKRGIHPKDWTYANVKAMRKQFSTMGTSIDWTKTMIACDPQYYRWNQWIFLKLYEKGLVYRGTMLSNWCPSCQTVLANEGVEAGKCWRCGSEVVQKEIPQWLVKITDYADRLIWKELPQADWPKPLRDGQNQWIGRKEGINIKYKVKGISGHPELVSGSTKKANGIPKPIRYAQDPEFTEGQVRNDNNLYIECFTTRPDTNFGATFIVLGPEHWFVAKLLKSKIKNQPFDSAQGNKSKIDEIRTYVDQAKKKTQEERIAEGAKKTGVFTGLYAMNNLNGKELPIWISDFVIGTVGTGAVIGVPAHDKRDFQFAKEFGLPIIRVVVSSDGDQALIEREDQVQEEEGTMMNSEFLNGLDIHEATKRIMDYLEEKGWGKRVINYNLHDWSISRQRYWGTPIPIIYCKDCGTVPVPEADLPVELPYKVDYTPKGKPPLATNEEWVKVTCPACGGEARREVETMDTFVDSAWYFYRYLDPKNDKAIFNKDIIAHWMPVDVYIGGGEHLTGHALYSRFITLFFHDLGLVPFEEYAQKRIHHGVILGEDGHRMSKSRGNVVNPDEEVKRYGADAIRVYLSFLGPFDIVASWNPDGVSGIYRFLQRVWNLQQKLKAQNSKPKNKTFPSSPPYEGGARGGEVLDNAGLNSEDLRIMHKTIKKVGEDIEEIKYNTAIATLMEWLNYLSDRESITTIEFEIFLKLLSPFAPHVTEELYQVPSTKDQGLRTKQFSVNESIHLKPWPVFDPALITQDRVEIVVQVNGKLRESLRMANQESRIKNQVEKKALASDKVKKYLEGKTIRKVIFVPGKLINFVV